eukprot:10749655-Alexandrium_andersonii.AAC.1
MGAHPSGEERGGQQFPRQGRKVRGGSMHFRPSTRKRNAILKLSAASLAQAIAYCAFVLSLG